MTNGDVRETFMHSIVIPTKDTMGRVVNLTQRRLDDHPVKYLNLPHKPLQNFFGIDILGDRHRFARETGLDQPVFICEGQFDTMVLQQNGLVALGVPGVNSMREVMFEHLKWFKSVVVCFDNDFPGEKAGLKMAQYIKHDYPTMKLYKIKWPKDYAKSGDVNKFFVEGGTGSEFLELMTELNVKPKSFKKPHKRKKGSTDEKLLKIKEIPIKEFVESIAPQLQWTKRDHLHKTKCPLPAHEDSVDSFTIYTETNTYFCFGCGCGGDIVNFCGKMFDTNFKTALNILSKWKDAR
jgi:DNA primase